MYPLTIFLFPLSTSTICLELKYNSALEILINSNCSLVSKLIAIIGFLALFQGINLLFITACSVLPDEVTNSRLLTLLFVLLLSMWLISTFPSGLSKNTSATSQ